jgi:Transcriptional regulator
VNYRQFEVFVAVIECGSVTAAAEKLNLSQPAVSKSLKLLETELGIRLFLRGIKGLQATDEGRSLYLEASRMTDNYAHLEGFARNLPQMEHARLEISCMPALSIFWLPQATAKFIHSYPDATLAFRSRSSPETVQLVARGSLTLASRRRLPRMQASKRSNFSICMRSASCRSATPWRKGGK